MIYRELGHSGIEVSAVGFGAWAIGGWMWGGGDDEQSLAAIHAALDHGINLIDTAPAYGYGHSEELSAGPSPDAATRSSWPPSAD